MSQANHPQRHPDVETYVLPDGTSLLFDPVTEFGHALDVLRSLIWDYCDGALSEAEIAREITALLPNDPSAGDVTIQFLAELAAKGLLVPQAVASGAP